MLLDYFMQGLFFGLFQKKINVNLILSQLMENYEIIYLNYIM